MLKFRSIVSIKRTTLLETKVCFITSRLASCNLLTTKDNVKHKKKQHLYWFLFSIVLCVRCITRHYHVVCFIIPCTVSSSGVVMGNSLRRRLYYV